MKAATLWLRRCAAVFVCLGILASVWVLCACNATEGPSTETGNPTISGVVLDTTGRPVGTARVMVYKLPIANAPVGVSGQAGFSDPMRVFITGSDGRFYFDSLPAGAYALGGQDTLRQWAAWIPRLQILFDSTPASAPVVGTLRDTLILKPVAWITGWAKRDANPYPPGVRGHENILVRVEGTPLATYTDTAGRYGFAGVPEGVFSLTFAAADGHYLPGRIDTLKVKAGTRVETPMMTLIWSPWSGAPPAPAGLQIMRDTVTPAIRLAWRPVFVANFSHYKVVRESSPPGAEGEWTTEDTLWTDSLSGVHSGMVVTYGVVAVDRLGNVSPQAAKDSVKAPLPPADTLVFRPWHLWILEDERPAQALVRLYVSATDPGSPDSLPAHAVLLDSQLTDAQGWARFSSLPSGRGRRFTAEASLVSGSSANAGELKKAIVYRGDFESAISRDTLRLVPVGAVLGTVTRQSLWCSTPAKGNENIEISLSGTPWWTATDLNGRFMLPEVAAGRYALIAQALPAGCFLPDTLEVQVLAGDTTELPVRHALPNPDFIPRITGLRFTSTGPDSVALAWLPVAPAFPSLAGYEVWRRIGSGEWMPMAQVKTGSHWAEAVSGLPPGEVVRYAVRVATTDGRRGALAGTDAGEPLEIRM